MTNKLTFKKIIHHFHTINKHRFMVFKLTCKCGIPWQGLKHDLSKYSLTEFIESARYYTGKHSPISDCKKDNGYSKAWLHHFGRNRHHHEYWYDYKAPIKTPLIPYKYVVEMICDDMAAGITYKGKDWTKDYQYHYFLDHKDKIYINEQIKSMLTFVYEEISIKGINMVLNKHNLKKIYNQYCGITK